MDTSDIAQPDQPPESGPDAMLWNGWGDPARAAPLPDGVEELLRGLLGIEPAAAPPAALAAVQVPPGRLAGPARTALAAAVGADHVRTDAGTRIRHTRGKSTPDLLRLRAGDAADAPDAVVLPGGHDEVLAVLRACAEHGVRVVPFGGGTSVTGGLAPRGAARAGEPGQASGRDGSGAAPRPFIALDLRRLDRLLALDPVSRTATLEAGVRAPAAERLLGERGFTLGHFPQSFEWATVGGFAATRGSGQASAGYGRFDEMVTGLTAATPRGTLEAGRAPRSAAGPDLRQLLLGSEGAFGVITSVTVRITPKPAERRYEGWRFPSFDAGTRAVRRLAQDGPPPTVLRLSDETETLAGLARPDAIGSDAGGSDAIGSDAAGPDAAGPGGQPSGCLLIAGYEGTAAGVADRQARVHAVLRAAGGEDLGGGPGASWAHGRYSAPYLRDALLDAGAFAETLETATYWSGLPDLYTAVRTALTDTLTAAGTPPLVLCHISHVYTTGASLYFTVVSAQGGDPAATWRRAKAAAGDAIAAHGGTISHHHGVGTDHRTWYAAEAGPLGVDVLRAVKATLDPDGVLNPGILIP